MDLPDTERRAGTLALDRLEPAELARAFAQADAEAAAAVAAASDSVAQAITLAARTLEGRGRLVLGGAGTSGRLAVIEAAECRPTFSSDRVLGCMAGGGEAFLQAKEGAEDDREAGAETARELGVGPDDLVLGVTASGRTPWVWGLLTEAKRRGATTGLIACSAPAEEGLDVAVTLETGPELLTGSTRLKAGTATKCVLNAITTGAMARAGKVLDDLMVDVAPTNAKLRDRARRIVAELAGVEQHDAAALLEACGWEVKTAIVSSRRGVDADRARELLSLTRGHLRRALVAE